MTQEITRERRLPDPGLEWRDGTAAASAFDDIYFSRAGGLEEARHVFLQGCGLPQAWTPAPTFAVGELGFGTGLNFLATWELWRRTRTPGARLHYVAVEGYPLTPRELEECLAAWPELQTLAQRLIRTYPEPQPGFHRLFLGDDVFVTLLFGDVATTLTQLEARVDAWFLDGFAPDKNPAMWRAEVFAQLARLSHRDTHLATYSVAGDVRRGLDAAGFDMTKTPGFGAKREMLRGRFRGTPQKSLLQPWFARAPHLDTGHAVIIGGGIAGTSIARALARRGWRSTIIDRNAALANEASGNPSAVLMPRLTAARNLDGRFYAAGWRFALQNLDGFTYDRCGLLQLATDDAEARRQGEIAAHGALPESLLTRVDAADASDIAGVKVARSALHFPQGGWLSPRSFCAAQSQGSDVILNTAVGALHHDGGTWAVMDESGAPIVRGDVVILANAVGAGSFPITSWMPLQVRRGQITLAPPTSVSRNLRTVLTYGGYITPVNGGLHSIGATFDWVDDATAPPEVVHEDHARNLADLARVLPEMMRDLATQALLGRAGLRCTTLDHLPMAGPLPNAPAYQRDFAELRHGHPWARYPEADYQPGLYTLTGLGARGLVSAPLAAEVIASHICGEPWPVERDLVTALHPGRFLVRDLKRREA
jgi:tRNA 5-methylaminomethyl-2-thiouridine biosynthesis bifunctional protein